MTATATQIQVLLVEDDAEVADAVRDGLRPLGFTVTQAASLATATRYLEQYEFQVAILDLTLPDGDGLNLAAKLRAEGNEIPILMLTARDGVADRLAGFDRGADDYLGKPFDVNELAARLRVIQRWLRKGTRHLLQYADLELDVLTRTARRPGLEVSLSEREAELLAYMMRHADEVLPRDRVLEELWGEEIDETSNLVNVYVNLIRNKIESPRLKPLIHTVRRVGYLLSTKEPAELG